MDTSSVDIASIEIDYWSATRVLMKDNILEVWIKYSKIVVEWSWRVYAKAKVRLGKMETWGKEWTFMDILWGMNFECMEMLANENFDFQNMTFKSKQVFKMSLHGKWISCICDMWFADERWVYM